MEQATEGAARIRISEGVFYNPKMRKLRSISVLFLRALGMRDARLLDATAATGARGIRYALEAGIRDGVLLDINPAACRNAKANVRLNGLRLRVLGKSLQEFAGASKEAFDVVDLDPFGTPVPLVHDALKVCKRHAVLMVTATDTATLCGAEAAACLRNYGSVPIHNELCHEAGVRILLYFVAREAAQFGFGIEPLLSIADMHYMRLFLRLEQGAEKAHESVRRSGFGAYCSNCHNFAYEAGIERRVDAKCGYCGKRMQFFGPLWLGGLHDKRLLGRMLRLRDGGDGDVRELLERVHGELDTPFFYSVPKATSYLGVGSVSQARVLAALSSGHRATRTHFDDDGIKTDAGTGAVIEAVRRASEE
jgi:tRNA (guanine26-N2/guanine27-N2)-dimethyltransferase